jgi:hypothetical protein
MSAHVHPVAVPVVHWLSTDIECSFGPAVDNAASSWTTRWRYVDSAPDTRRCLPNRISGAHA